MTTVYAQRRAALAPPTPRRSPVGAVLAVLWGGAAAVIALWWHDTGSVVGASGWLTGAGRIAGLLCGYACAVLVGLMARVPLLEQRVGADRVTRWHTKVGRYTICLLVAHVVLILLGYAAQDGSSIVDETLTVVLDYPEMLKATAGAVILCAVGLVSARAVRRRVSHEFSYAVPQLTREALTAQSADIDTVSGATYTSEGYRQSLQSALDSASR
ncbi:ferric reductase-like transmembrane domain-containing protein [Streptomyces sp. TRM68367]|nr:ferric reductase-like transmembrane domain-containing protein [Streptomyces sp. TRM68367]